MKSIEKLEPEWVGTEVHLLHVITVAIDEVFFNRSTAELTPGSDIVFTNDTNPVFVPEEKVNSALKVGSRTILVLGENGSSTDNADGANGLAPWDFWISPDLTAPSTEITGCVSIIVHGMSESLGAMTSTMEKVLDSHPWMRVDIETENDGASVGGESGHSSLWRFAGDAIDSFFSALRDRVDSPPH
ncbi:MAG: hypothetical protein GEU79_14710 [Acidimicrobiia bacterium]|nr:hypothetical protein [Acidimicrobiia bacterium]